VPCVAQPGGPPPPVEIIWFQPNPAAPTWGESGPPVWEYDVIAGSVVELTAPEIRDLDTYTDQGALAAGVPLGTQVEDHTWKYLVVASDGEILVPENWSEYRTDRTFTWRAPDEEGDVAFTFMAKDCTPANEHWGTDNAPTSRSEEGNPVEYLAGVVHVHRLQVLNVWGGLEMYQERDATNDDWHGDWDGEELHHWQCDMWDNDPNNQVPYHKYSRGVDMNPDPELTTNPVPFDGGGTAYVSVQLRCADGHDVDVIPQTIRLHAPWTDEGAGLEFSASGTVEHLPTQCFNTATSQPIDQVVRFYDTVTWGWEYDIPYGSAYQTNNHDLVDNPAMEDVATSYAGPREPVEVTPLRVKAVYTAMSLCGTDIAVAREAAKWARTAGFAGDAVSWRDFHPHRDDADAWCLRCSGRGGDCITLAVLAADACRLAGLEASTGVAYPQDEWACEWDQPMPCFAYNADAFYLDHTTRNLEFWYVSNSNFEGYFGAADRVWTCAPEPGEHLQGGEPEAAPLGGWDCVQAMLTDIAYNSNGGPEGWGCTGLFWFDDNENGLEDEGEARPRWWYHGAPDTYLGQEHTHLVPEPGRPE